MLFGRGWVLVVMMLAATGCGWSAGPRWVTGAPYFTTSGQPVIWYTDTPQYFTDPGDLSSTVNHAAADALVAAAAAVWNVPTSRLVLSKGGSLDEHVSGMNAYVGTGSGSGSGGVVFPADVLPGNYLAKQIAVIYDRDGSVTDRLLGVGGSDPSGCRQSAVTESVDSIVPSGYIQHAVLVLNGRCTGAAPEAQLQMQYQLMRAFGRVLGLGWSQTNDNVFTGSPQATPQQMLHWPIMHPIDIICGPYTYQCLPQPFTLRDDDVSGMALLYYIAQGQAGPGKTDSLLNANRVGGRIIFPTGQGMQGVNVVGRRLQQYTLDSNVEKWDDVSSVSGFLYRQTNPTAVGGVDPSMEGSMGTANCCYEGRYLFGRIPMLFGNWQWIVVETEPVNPMYVGAYSVGPYTTNTVQPSGANISSKTGIYGSYADAQWLDFTIGDAASSCPYSTAGMEASPDVVPATGWWGGLLCGWWQTGAWSGLTVKGNRSLTIETTAEDEAGFASTAKAMPVIGVWRASDAVGSSPTVAAVAEAFTGSSAGMTSLTVSGLQAGDLRMEIVDQRGDVRPDFNFGARVLYADTIFPSSVGAGGGVVTITGMGFRPGNVVTVNGVAATVQSWTATTIVATVPASRAPTAVVTDVQVRDVMTGGTTAMTGALAYAAPAAESMMLVSSPSGTVFVGDVAGTFSVRVLGADGVTPVVGEAVVFSASGAAVRFGACGAGVCTVLTDASGMASSTVTALGAGVVGLSAVGSAASAGGQFTAVVRVRTVVALRPMEYVAAGATVAWSPQVMLTDNSAAVAGVGVSGGVVWGAMRLGWGSSLAFGAGVATGGVVMGPLGVGDQAMGSACAWGGDGVCGVRDGGG